MRCGWKGTSLRGFLTPNSSNGHRFAFAIAFGWLCRELRRQHGGGASLAAGPRAAAPST